MAVSLEEMSDAIKRYYEFHDKGKDAYATDHCSRKGIYKYKFPRWCLKHGYDIHDIEKELKAMPTIGFLESKLLTYSSSFPTGVKEYDAPKRNLFYPKLEKRNRIIHKVLLKCLKDPNAYKFSLIIKQSKNWREQIFDIVTHQFQLLFDGYMRKEIRDCRDKYKLVIPIDTIQICQLFFGTDLIHKYSILPKEKTVEDDMTEMLSTMRQNGDFQLASIFVTLWMDYDPHKGWCYHRRSMIYFFHQHQLQDAINDMKMAVRFREHWSHGLYYYGYLMERSKDYCAALSLYVDAISKEDRIKPDTKDKIENLVKYHKAKIRVLIKLKEYTDAGEVYRKLFELDGSEAKYYYQAALFLLTYEYKEDGDDSNETLEKAKKYIEAAIEKDSNNGMYYAYYAKICRMMNEDEVFISVYVHKALELADNYTVLQVLSCDM